MGARRILVRALPRLAGGPGVPLGIMMALAFVAEASWPYRFERQRAALVIAYVVRFLSLSFGTLAVAWAT